MDHNKFATIYHKYPDVEDQNVLKFLYFFTERFRNHPVVDLHDELNTTEQDYWIQGYMDCLQMDHFGFIVKAIMKFFSTRPRWDQSKLEWVKL